MSLVFNENGVLSPGDYPMTIEQLKNSLLVQGPGGGVPWNQQKRFMLVTNLSILVDQLHQVGIDEIFIDGSFVEDKANPSDIDGCNEPLLSIRYCTGFNKIDPHKIWTWDWKSRVYDRNSSKPQLPMWYRYKVELYPHVGQESGILDEYGHQQMFPAAFRKTRDTFLPKGIIKFIKEIVSPGFDGQLTAVYTDFRQRSERVL